MEILHINPSTKNVNQFDKMVNAGKHVFVLIYMEGCGPCNETRPEWTKIENILGKSQEKIKYPNVVIADVDQNVSNNIKHIGNISHFPTMKYISGKGKIIEEYEGERNIDAFINWIDRKHGNVVDNTPSSRSIRGGRRRRRSSRTRSRSTRKNRYRQSHKNASWKKKYNSKRY